MRFDPGDTVLIIDGPRAGETARILKFYAPKDSAPASSGFPATTPGETLALLDLVSLHDGRIGVVAKPQWLAPPGAWKKQTNRARERSRT